MSTSQEKPKSAKNHKKLERSEKGSSPRDFRDSVVLPIP